MIERSTQFTLFLENKPGELARLSHMLGDNGINILALSIQDPVAYIKRLFRAREQTLRRIASTASYRAILKEAAQLTLIRFVTEDPEKSTRVLQKSGYKVEAQEVILALMGNRPGQLASISEDFAREGININYTYGSALNDVDKSLFVFHVSDTEKALKALKG